MWAAIKKIGGLLLGGVLEHFKDKRDLKREIQLAKLQREAKIASADIEWDQIAAQQSANSWKDEAWTLLFIIIFAAAFVPGMDIYIMKGFAVLEQTPEWFKLYAGTAVAFAFGRSELIKIKNNIVNKD